MLAILFIVPPQLVIAQEIGISLEADFWNFVYVVDAEVIELNSPQVVVEVNLSWNENALPGDTLVLRAITGGIVSAGDTLPRKPPRLPLHPGDNYLFFVDGSCIAAFGVEGVGFYRIRGCGASNLGDWSGYRFSPEYIATSELDSLAVHIGNNPHFESREYNRHFLFPSGEWLTSDELSQFNLFETTDNIGDLDFFSVVDSCVGNCFCISLIPRGSILGSQWIPQWIKGSRRPVSVSVSHLVDLGSSELISAPSSIEFIDNSRIRLYFESTVMSAGFGLSRIPYEEGAIELVLAELDSSGSWAQEQERIMLRFPELERLPAMPDVFVIESALCRGQLVQIEMLHADSSDGKYWPIMTYTIELNDSTVNNL